MSRPKAPYRVLYSNDTTNILTCESSYHAAGEAFRPEMLAATVDEVAGGGVDAHFIQLAHGQVPWYQSRVYPMREHHEWWQGHFGVDPGNDAFNVGGVHRFILDGGDPLQVFVDRCRLTGQAPFVSMRLNDVHHVENVGTPGNVKGIHAISRFYAENPQYRLAPDLANWHTRVLNWAEPAVRDYAFALIAEQIRNYDIEGFELDFMRHCNFFRREETTPAQRCNIMTDFIHRVRAVLDESLPKRYRWLCVRIPCYLSAFEPMGIDLPAWTEAGVDMVNLSPYYFTVQQTDLPAIRRLVPAAALYLEMCHSSWNGRAVAKGYDNFTFRRVTPEQYQTAAHLAYACGADGVSTFNFVYYRKHGVGERGPFNEPPFEVLKHIGQPHWLSSRPQHWFVAPGWRSPFGGETVPMPRRCLQGTPESFDLLLVPPCSGWKEGGRLRVQAEAELADSRWAATFNGTDLAPVADCSEPYPNPYPPLLGESAAMRAWQVPAEALRIGYNRVRLELQAGTSAATIVFLDLSAR
jgi:hypothetical protein